MLGKTTEPGVKMISPQDINLEIIHNFKLGCWSIESDSEVKKGLIKNPHSCPKYSVCEIQQYLTDLFNKIRGEIDKQMLECREYYMDSTKEKRLRIMASAEEEIWRKANQIIQNNIEVKKG